MTDGAGAPAPRKPRMAILYGILVTLLVIGGLLLLSGEAVYALLVLAIATLLNVRLLALRRRLARRGTEPDR